jgi:MoxR-like ATPase
MNFLTIQPGHIYKPKYSTSQPGLPALVHQFERDQIRAVNAALAAGRPLLVRGEPGIGKSQLAKAVAGELQRAFISQTVDSRTESRDLLYHFDAVARLADAQILGCQPKTSPGNPPEAGKDKEQAAVCRVGTQLLPPADYLRPRALWWAFAWEDAKGRAEKAGIGIPNHPEDWEPKHGCVVLIDEIDKAESDVPNGLLEALGAHSFHPQGLGRPVVASSTPPLVIITTNEERALPDAFVRRCLILHLQLPKERTRLKKHLISRGQAHFEGMTSNNVLQTAANCLIDDRQEAAQQHWHPLPGQAEYLDLLRAVIGQRPNDHSAQEELLAEIKRFILRKHPDAATEDMRTEETAANLEDTP